LFKGRSGSCEPLRRQYLQNYLDFKIWYTTLYGECPAGAQIIFPIRGLGAVHVTPAILGIRLNISSKLFQLVTSNLVSGFNLPLLFDCRVLHTIVYCEAVRSAILMTIWLLVLYGPVI